MSSLTYGETMTLIYWVILMYTVLKRVLVAPLACKLLLITAVKNADILLTFLLNSSILFTVWKAIFYLQYKKVKQ